MEIVIGTGDEMGIVETCVGKNGDLMGFIGIYIPSTNTDPAKNGHTRLLSAMSSLLIPRVYGGSPIILERVPNPLTRSQLQLANFDVSPPLQHMLQ